MLRLDKIALLYWFVFEHGHPHSWIKKLCYAMAFLCCFLWNDGCKLGSWSIITHWSINIHEKKSNWFLNNKIVFSLWNHEVAPGQLRSTRPSFGTGTWVTRVIQGSLVWSLVAAPCADRIDYFSSNGLFGNFVVEKWIRKFVCSCFVVVCGDRYYIYVEIDPTKAIFADSNCIGNSNDLLCGNFAR